LAFLLKLQPFMHRRLHFQTFQEHFHLSETS
jgi:hypothetical protein